MSSSTSSRQPGCRRTHPDWAGFRLARALRGAVADADPTHPAAALRPRRADPNSARPQHYLVFDGVTVNTDIWAPTADDMTVGRMGRPGWTREPFMSDTDLNGQFEKIADTARTATDKIRVAGERTRDQLKADVDAARKKADAAADRVKDKAIAARGHATSDWQEIRDKWHAHVGKIRARASETKDRIDAHNASVDADMSEAYAYDAMDFALDAIAEAEYAALDAIYARANSQVLNA
jgi:hypothetical protein